MFRFFFFFFATVCATGNLKEMSGKFNFPSVEGKGNVKTKRAEKNKEGRWQWNNFQDKKRTSRQKRIQSMMC